MSHLAWFGNTGFETDVCCQPVLSPRGLSPQNKPPILEIWSTI